MCIGAAAGERVDTQGGKSRRASSAQACSNARPPRTAKSMAARRNGGDGSAARAAPILPLIIAAADACIAREKLPL
jgi:hypothetical protein